MANARALDKRRKSIRNIRKITRTMELIATARFKQAMDRASAATAFTDRMTRLVADLASTGLEVSHPLLEEREQPQNAVLLVLTSNRGLCGGYNGNVLRLATERRSELVAEVPNTRLEISGKRGVSYMKYREIPIDETFTHFEDKPTFDEVDVLASRFLDDFVVGKLDRLDVAYTRFLSSARQQATVETLLPLGSLGEEEAGGGSGNTMYEFLPSAQSILEEVVPTSFKVKLFKCFLDAAVSEQIARMVAMKSATENADEIIRNLSMTYNRARQSQITGELLEVMGGVEALKN
ncbi:MAG: ATP synthase F1 subunit gamma [Planctomycetota bacterium]|nr:MAG: ATP synthase F1 subunit gamma [Planctomycetota bacterium]REK43308.1 MAG: ATP synthase F1 subunit gamma [Planctomycetota bacterium]